MIIGVLSEEIGKILSLGGRVERGKGYLTAWTTPQSIGSQETALVRQRGEKCGLKTRKKRDWEVP